MYLHTISRRVDNLAFCMQKLKILEGNFFLLSMLKGTCQYPPFKSCVLEQQLPVNASFFHSHIQFLVLHLEPTGVVFFDEHYM